MSQQLTRTYSLRRPVRPLIDRDEADDDQRRDSAGRKRVDVVQCLLDSSSDELDAFDPIDETINPILWLTFNEICHIRYVLAQTTLSLLMLSDEKQFSKISHARLCFRCRRSIKDFFFLFSFFRPSPHSSCFICQQTICKNCVFVDFRPPSTKLSIPVRIQTLLASRSESISTEKGCSTESNALTQTVCFDCAQVFHEHMQTSQSMVTPFVSPFRRTLSLPPKSSQNTNDSRHTRHRRRPMQITNCKIETKTITTTSLIADF